MARPGRRRLTSTRRFAALVGNSSGRSMLRVAGFHAASLPLSTTSAARTPPSMWPLEPTPGRFTISGRGSETSRIAASNSARYDVHVRLIEAIDLAQAARLYRTIYPQLQEAYRQRGYPKGYFNDRFVEVIDPCWRRRRRRAGRGATDRSERAASVDAPLGAPRVRRAGVRSARRRPEDPAAVGREHRKRLEAKLASIRAVLTTSGIRRP